MDALFGVTAEIEAMTEWFTTEEKKHSQRLTDIVKNNEGVWIFTKLFYVVGSLSLISIYYCPLNLFYPPYLLLLSLDKPPI